MTTSILAKLAGMNKTTVSESRVEMTEKQFQQCKEALRRDNRGYNVQPNKFDLNTPYRVAINYKNEWNNFGNFKCAHVAAAIGSIVSVAFFGDKAKAGEYDAEIVEKSEEFHNWLADSRNADVIAMASGEKPTMQDGGTLAKAANVQDDNDENPF